jgi:hypothetical protein
MLPLQNPANHSNLKIPLQLIHNRRRRALNRQLLRVLHPLPNLPVRKSFHVKSTTTVNCVSRGKSESNRRVNTFSSIETIVPVSNESAFPCSAILYGVRDSIFLSTASVKRISHSRR